MEDVLRDKRNNEMISERRKQGPRHEQRLREAIESLEVLRRQMMRDLRRPLFVPIPEHHAEGYLLQRVRTFRSRIMVAVNAILTAAILYLLIDVLAPGMTGGRAAFPVLVMAVLEILLLVVSRSVRTLRAIQLLAGATVAIPAFLFFQYGIPDASFYILLLLFGGFVYPWSPFGSVVVSLLPIFAFLSVRGIAEDDAWLTRPEILIFLLTTVVVASLQVARERGARIEYILSAEARSTEEDMLQGLRTAARIHAMIISGDVITECVEARVFYEPMQMLGGDYIKILPVDDDRTAMVLADVTGHGAPGALLVNRVDSFVENLMRQRLRPGVAAEALNRRAMEIFFGSGMLMTAFWAEYDCREGVLRWVNFGHPPALLVRTATGAIEELRAGFLPMGISEPEEPVEASVTVPESGDVILFYTDGLIETRTSEGVVGLPTLKEFLRKRWEDGRMDPGMIVADLKEYLERNRIGDAHDDVLFTVWKIGTKRRRRG
ncbi:MAG: hypothetical protein D6679_12410 [Candidatus Hydrogenedentota bacterium]|nr:MAG: hypothetical protein D6679_12410 [Candidatus Hydrogenedentota bacterium]